MPQLIGAFAEDVPQLLNAPNQFREPDSHSPGQGRSKDAMTELLHWALEHSDTDKVKELMQKYEDNNLTIKDAYGQDVFDALFVNEADVMQQTVVQIQDFNNASVTEEELEGSLMQLQEMIEQVDNAGNLHKMGGLEALLQLAIGSRRTIHIRALSLWTLGIAVQNNEPVQADLMSINGLGRLIALLPHCGAGTGVASDLQLTDDDTEYCSKLLFVLSGLVRNDATIQVAADESGLFDWLIDVGIRHSSPLVVKKVLGFLDTVLAQTPDLPFLANISARQDSIASALLSHMHAAKALASSIDIIEKVLHLINRFVVLRPFLFGSSFRSQLSLAAQTGLQQCGAVYGTSDEICDGMHALARQVDAILATHDISDDEL